MLYPFYKCVIQLYNYIYLFYKILYFLIDLIVLLCILHYILYIFFFSLIDYDLFNNLLNKSIIDKPISLSHVY